MNQLAVRKSFHLTKCRDTDFWFSGQNEGSMRELAPQASAAMEARSRSVKPMVP